MTTVPATQWNNPHDRLDDIRRRVHVAIAAKIDADPALLDVPRRNIQRWTKLWGYLHPADAERLGILERPWPQVRRPVVADDENPKRSRPSTPSVGEFSSWERRTIHELAPS